jgi:hypothetical protein
MAALFDQSCRSRLPVTGRPVFALAYSNAQRSQARTDWNYREHMATGFKGARGLVVSVEPLKNAARDQLLLTAADLMFCPVSKGTDTVAANHQPLIGPT